MSLVETDPRYIAMLERIVGQAKELQQTGRLADSGSRREVAMLEHRLRALRAQAQATDPDRRTASPGRAAVVARWSREVCAMSADTRRHTRQLRKELYRLRLITGSPSS
ncbi:MAG: hypothetical protein J2P44_04805 [Candidatus Dormibacteraeota bacterium]|nr:hypothetical protein [Candidatus Dormibacteraeota bacterium]